MAAEDPVGIFATQMNSLVNRGSNPYYLSMAWRILNTPDWRRVEPNRPYDWANLEQTSPEWFKTYINFQAPMLAAGGLPLDPQHAGSAIWFAARPRSRTVDTITNYVLTRAQTQDLCDPFGKSCARLTENDQRPPFIPEYVFE